MRWKSSFFVLSLYVSWLFPCHQCTRNWSRSWVRLSLTIGDTFCGELVETVLVWERDRATP